MSDTGSNLPGSEISDPRALPQPKAETAGSIVIDLRTMSSNRAASPLPAATPANPRQLAVALSYDGQNAPTVVASGRGELARKILEIAFAAGVRVREDATLAQSLAAIETGNPIPLDCYEAVAEIINYLYRLDAAPPQFLP